MKVGKATDSETKSMDDLAIVAFIDIMGYKALVTRQKYNTEVISYLESLLERLSTDLPDKMKNMRSEDNAARRWFNQFLDLMKVRLISDTKKYTG